MNQVLERPKHATFHKRKSQSGPAFKVILYNDHINHIRYVQSVLKQTFRDMTEKELIEKSWEAHNIGTSIVKVCSQDHAELFCEHLRLYNLKSLIEPL